MLLPNEIWLLYTPWWQKYTQEWALQAAVNVRGMLSAKWNLIEYCAHHHDNSAQNGLCMLRSGFWHSWIHTTTRHKVICKPTTYETMQNSLAQQGPGYAICNHLFICIYQSKSTMNHVKSQVVWNSAMVKTKCLVETCWNASKTTRSCNIFSLQGLPSPR